MTDEFLDNWSRQMRKGVLELYVLNALRGERLYGYDLVRRLRDVDSLIITEGTLYPLLARLKREGLVETTLEESSEGPARKYYRLAPRGEAALEHMNQHWQQIVHGIEATRKERSS